MNVPAGNGTVAMTDQLQNFRNKFINGNFDFWQRATSANLTTASYPAPDRWIWIYDGTSASTNTVSRQTFALGQTDVPGNPKYFMQYTYGVTNTPSNYFRQNIESVLTLAGRTCTVSFWARCTSGTVACTFQNQQEFGAGGSPSAGVYGIGSTAFTLTTTWQKFVFTHTLPSIAGKTVGTSHDGSINPSFTFPTNAGNTVQFAQMQFEEGSVATPFERRPFGTELALCQRYFFQSQTFGSNSTGLTSNHFLVYGALAGAAQWMFAKSFWPVKMRANPGAVSTSDAAGTIGRLSILTSVGGVTANNIVPYSVYSDPDGYSISVYNQAKYGFFGAIRADAEL
jgi:hypothetical protein